MIDDILENMCVVENNYDIQKIQTEHRLKLIEKWQIKKGSKVLEIGCGQGDTTAALAYIVGDTGFVYGIDIASPDYGAPVTLGEAREKLLNSKLKKQLKIDFNIDILKDNIGYEDKYFDYVVLSHCSWYFMSHKQFLDILIKAKKLGKKLCFAEWDIRVKIPEQIPHYTAALIQAQCECFLSESNSNIRTLLSPYDIKTLIKDAGWNIICESEVYSEKLQDGLWEVNEAIGYYSDIIDNKFKSPEKFRDLLLSQIELLKNTDKDKIKPLSSFLLIAE